MSLYGERIITNWVNINQCPPKLITALSEEFEENDLRYKRQLEHFRRERDNGADWVEILRLYYERNAPGYMFPFIYEIFVRLVEEDKGVEVISIQQLIDLTSIASNYKYWYYCRGFFNENERSHLPKRKRRTPLEQFIASSPKAQTEIYNHFKEFFTEAMKYRYCQTLSRMMSLGANNDEMMLVNPSDFNLPEDFNREKCLF